MKVPRTLVLYALHFLSAPKADFSSSSVTLDDVMNKTFKYWNLFRDAKNGFWCDSVKFHARNRCGGKNVFYSSAGTGAGLVSDCIQAELGFLSRDQAHQRALQTLNSLVNSWPREPFHGFFVHFANGNRAARGSEYSTIDTALMTAGAIFAGNYFGGEAASKAEELFMLTNWQQSLKDKYDPTIYPIINASSGQMGGNIKPFNEYFILAYMAKRQGSGKASDFFETFFGASGKPKGAHGFPKYFNYWGYELQSDHRGAVSSFIPQFCYYFTKGYQENPYHMGVFRNWLLADRKFWDLATPANAHVWGKPIKGYAWGSGAGPDPQGYIADKIDNNRELTFSVPIMAGFLPIADEEQTSTITSQIRHLYDNDICTYNVDGVGKILWRCSVKQPNWKADHADSIDFSSMVFGYASLFLPGGFYGKYAVDANVTDVIV